MAEISNDPTILPTNSALEQLGNLDSHTFLLQQILLELRRHSLILMNSFSTDYIKTGDLDLQNTLE